MNDAIANWEVKIENDGFEFRVKCINNDFFSELYIEGNKVYISNKEEISNYFINMIHSLTPDDKLKYWQNFLLKTNNFQHHINDNMDEIGNQSQGNASNIYMLALEAFVTLLTLIDDKIKSSIVPIAPKVNNSDPPKLLQELIDEGQINEKDGKYYFYKTPKAFIDWCVDNNYFDEEIKGIDTLSAKFIHKNIETNVSIETIKKYIRNAKTGKKN